MTKAFEDINEKNQKKLLRMLEANVYHYKKNSNILSTIKNVNMIGIITKGYIQITRSNDNGSRTIIEEVEEEEIFGTFISSLKSKDYEIITKEDTDIIMIDYDLLIQNNFRNCEYYHQFIKNMFEFVTKKIQEKNERIEILTQKSIRNKLLEYFNIMFKKTGSKYIYLPFTFMDLADYLAVDRSAMSRELKNLKEEGFIEIKGKKITLCYDKNSSIYMGL